MRIAICDDEKMIVDILEEKLQRYSIAHGQELHIQRYYSGEELLADDISQAELLFLDISMPGLNGMETAKEIRKFNTSIKIVFLTSYSEFVFESFKVEAFRYLLKPLKEQELIETLDALREDADNPDEYFSFTFNNEKYNIRYKDIIYVEGMRDKLWIICHGGTYRWLGTMKGIAKELEGRGFFQVHRSYIINMDKVKSYTSQSVHLEEDYDVPISKYRLNEFKEEYLQHWSKIL